MSDIITNAAAEAAFNRHWQGSQGRGLFTESAQTEHWHDILEAALPHIEAAVRERVFDELIASAGEQRVVMPHENEGYPDTSDNFSEDMESLANWLRFERDNE